MHYEIQWKSKNYAHTHSQTQAHIEHTAFIVTHAHTNTHAIGLPCAFVPHFEIKSTARFAVHIVFKQTYTHIHTQAHLHTRARIHSHQRAYTRCSIKLCEHLRHWLRRDSKHEDRKERIYWIELYCTSHLFNLSSV